MIMATELTIAQKKEYAGVLYLKDNLTQQEIAEKVGVSRQTLSKWVKAEKWEERKVGITLTREDQIANLHRQVAEINKAIMEREAGKRYATPPEADTLGKLLHTRVKKGILFLLQPTTVISRFCIPPKASRTSPIQRIRWPALLWARIRKFSSSMAGFAMSRQRFFPPWAFSNPKK